MRLNELLRVITLVRAQRDGGFPVRQGLPGIVDHGLGRFALGVAVGPRHHSAGNQPAAVVAQRWPMKRSSLAAPPLRYSLASPSVLDSYMSFERL